MRFSTFFFGFALLLASFPIFAQSADNPIGCGTDENIRELKKMGLWPPKLEQPAHKGPGDLVEESFLPPVCEIEGAIPVVVHIIHLGEAEGTGSNIPTSQVQDAINGLNDQWNNISGNGSPLGVAFKLATRDPNGNPTNGITRTNGSSVPNYAANGVQQGANPGAADASIKALVRWPQDQYYNIWVVHNIAGGVAGYAYYPQPTPFLADGTMIEDNYMVYNSNVLAHELGHAFNLAHTFDDDDAGCPPNADCTLDGDEVCDTPPHRQADCGPTNPCTPAGVWTNSYRNIMSYCGNSDRFTAGQRDRVQAALRNTSRRLLIGNASLVPPNNLREAGLLSIIFPKAILCGPTFKPIVRIRNYGTTAINNMGFEIRIDGNLATQFTLSATIPPGQTTNVELNNVTMGPGAHDMDIRLVAINGLTDESVLTDNKICARIQRIDAQPSVCVPFEGPGLPTELVYQDSQFFKVQNVAGVCPTQENRVLKVDGTRPGATSFSFSMGPVDLSNNNAPKLSFEMARSRNRCSDALLGRTYIEVSKDCGKTFSTIFDKNDAAFDCNPLGWQIGPPLYSTGVSGPDNYTFVPTNCNQWRTEAIDLSNYTGETVILRFNVTFTLDSQENNVVYFDNICLKNCSTASQNLITTQPPDSIDLCNGGSTVLNMGINGTLGGVSYSWQRSADPTSGYFGAGSINNFNTGVIALGSHYYIGVATKNGCPDSTRLIKINVHPDILVDEQPTSVAFCTGETRVIKATYLNGGPNVFYQWETASALAGPWTQLSGPNDSIFIPPANLGTTYYRVTFGSADPGCQSVTSLPVATNVDPALNVVSEPQPLGGCVGGTGTFQINVTGGTPIYKWQRSASATGPWNDFGWTQSSYSPSFDAPGSSYYRVVLTSLNNYCRDTSAVASLTIAPNQSITVQPVDVSGCAGPNNALRVEVSGGIEPLQYQWQSTPDFLSSPFADVPGANTAIYNPGAAGNSQFYRVIVRSPGAGCNDDASTFAFYNVDNAVSISAQPQDINECIGGSDVLSVTGTGAASINYQWQSATSLTGPWNNVGDNQNTHTPPSATPGSEYFRVILISGASTCQDTSVAAKVAVAPQPNISVQPLSYSACQSATRLLSVTAAGGTGTLTYQWQAAANAAGPWSDIAGATQATYNPNLGSGSRFYRVVVSSAGCTNAVSDAANVIVDSPVSITAEPQNLTQCVGSTQPFSVTAGGTGVQYQWQSAAAATGPFANIASATASTYAPPSAALGTAYYRVVASSTNGGCRDTSVVAAAITRGDPTITAQPVGANGCGVANASMSVTATGGSTLTYQWQSSPAVAGPFTNISGASNPTYTPPPVGNGLYYRVIVRSNNPGCDDATSAVTGYFNDQPVTISAEPQNINECVGGTQPFTVTSSNTGTVNYQWQVAGAATGPWNNIGTNQNSLVPAAGAPGTAFYRVFLTSAGGFCKDTSVVVSATAVNLQTITTQPVGNSACQTATAAPLSVTATGGSGSLTYQWQSASSAAGPWTNVTGATNNTYTPANNVGSTFYRVLVSATASGCTAVNSTAVNVVRDAAVTVTADPLNITECAGSAQSVNATATGGGTLSYQWQSASAPAGPFADVAGATQNTFTPPSATAGTVYYRLVASSANGLCRDTSTAATVAVSAGPTITAQPVGASGCGVASSNLSVTATGGIGSLTYQWQSGPTATGPFTDIGGATSTNYAPGTGSTQFFRVIVRSAGCADAISNATSTNSDNPVSVTADPANLTQCVGGTQTLTVTGTGSAIINYQWQSGPAATGPWTNVGTNQNTFNPPSTNAGTVFYRAIISSQGGFCKDTSVAATATTSTAQSISAQPNGYTACQSGSIAPLTVTASGGIGALGYQWQSGTSATGPWTDVSGATNASYNPGNAPKNTFYRVRVSAANPGCPDIFSNAANVVVDPSATISTEPQNAAQCIGGNQSITAASTSTGTLTYQWQQANAATGPWTNTGTNQNSVTPVTTAAGTTFYRLMLSSANGACRDTSVTVTSLVSSGPTITAQPIGVSGCAGSSSSSLSVTATGGTGSLTYQWQSGPTATGPFTDVSGANAASFTPSAGNTAPFYRVIVRSTGVGCLDAVSNVASLNGDNPVSITAEPQNIGQCLGGTLAFNLSATGTGTVNYQWQTATAAAGPWTNIGGNQASFAPGAAVVGNVFYRAIVSSTNGFCRDTSATVTATTFADPRIDTQPAGVTGCATGASSLNVAASGGTGTLDYQWQSAASAAGPFADVAGANTATYSPGVAGSGLFYRVIVRSTGSGCGNATSIPVNVILDAPVSITTEPANVTECQGGTQAVSLVATGTNLNYQWQRSTLPTGPWTNTGSNLANVTPPGTAVGISYYRAIVTSTNGYCRDTSNAATINVVSDPSITTQPVGFSGCASGSTNLTVAATGGVTLTYQWQSSNAAAGPFSDISGATGSQYNLTAATGTRFYRVVVGSSGSGCNNINSTAVNVTVDPAVTITAEPQNLTQCAGGTGTLSVTASSTNAIQYQWQSATNMNGPWTNTGTNAASFTPPAPGAGTFFYRVIASSGTGLCKDTSAVATATIVAAPAIVAQPTNFSACASGSATLNVTASGGFNLSYQWQSATSATGPWSNVAGATNTQYSITAATGTRYYRVVVSSTGNGCTAVNSAAATVTLDPTVTINTDPQNISQCVGGSANLTANATSTGTVQYQWQSAANATGPWTNVGTNANSFAPPATAAGATFYRVITSSVNGLCKDTSSNATATVLADPSITTQPANFSGCLSGAVNLTVAATGGVAPLTYQWQSSTSATGPWVNVNGATTAQFGVPATTGTRFYRAVVSSPGSGCDAANSNPANITLDQVLAITTEPQNTNQCVGGTAGLSVTVNSTGTAQYQWQSATNANGPWNNIAGATQTTFAPNTGAAGTTFYRVLLASSNGLCKDTSLVATAVIATSPSVTTQPANFSGCAATPTPLTVAATGGIAPLTYQWQSASAATGPWANVGGATSANFTPPANNGTVFYRAVVSSAASGCTPANSNPASVLIEAAVNVVANPQPIFQCVGGSAALSTVGTGSASPGYQWQQASAATGPWTNITGATQNTYTPASSTVGLSFFRVILTSTNGLCRDTSSAAASTVTDNVVISAQPQGVEACVGGLLTLTSGATGGIAPTFQWQSATNANGPWNNIAGATQATYNPPLTTPGTVFYRMTATSVASGCTNAISNAASVFLHPKVDVSAQPQNISECVGGNTALSATAIGGTALTYQWQVSANNGQSWQNVSGATANTYVPPSNQNNSTRLYRLVVRDALATCGADTSANARVVVNTNFRVRDTVEVCNVANGSSTALLNFNSFVVSGDPNAAWTSLDTVPPAGAWTAKDFTAFTPGKLYRFVATTTNATPPCINVSDTLTVRVKNCCPAVCTNAPTAAYCNSGGQLLNLNTLVCAGVEAGTWTLTTGPGVSTPTPVANASFDPSGKIPGAYVLRYTLARTLPAVCGTVSDEVVNVVKAPEAGTLTVPQLNLCDNKDTLFTLANLITGEDSTGVWTEISSVPSASGAFNAATGKLNTTSLVSGGYRFRYRVPGGNGCPADEVTLNVLVSATPAAQAGDAATLTCDEPEVTLGNSAQTPTANVRYVWTEAAQSAPIQNGNKPTLLITAPGIYRLRAVDTITGCFAEDQVRIQASQNYITDLQIDFDDPLCHGDNNGEILVVGVTGGTAPFRYILNGTAKNNNKFTRLTGGDYLLRVEDRDGCFTERTVTLQDPPEVKFTFSGDTTVYCGDPVLLRANPGLDPALIKSIKWAQNGVPLDSFKTLRALVMPEQNAVYQLILADKNGCSSTQESRITVNEDIPIYVPNAFAPDADSDNSIFQVSTNERINLVKSLRVFDRGGNLVWEQLNFDPRTNTAGWDGRFRNKPAPVGVYVYQIEVESCAGKVRLLKGSLTLVR